MSPLSSSLHDVVLPPNTDHIDALTAPVGNPVLQRRLSSFETNSYSNSPLSSGNGGSDGGGSGMRDPRVRGPLSRLPSSDLSPHYSARSANTVHSSHSEGRTSASSGEGRAYLSASDLEEGAESEVARMLLLSTHARTDGRGDGRGDRRSRALSNNVRSSDYLSGMRDPIMDPTYPENAVPGVPMPMTGGGGGSGGRLRTSSYASTGTNNTNDSNSNSSLGAGGGDVESRVYGMGGYEGSSYADLGLVPPDFVRTFSGVSASSGASGQSTHSDRGNVQGGAPGAPPLSYASASDVDIESGASDAEGGAYGGGGERGRGMHDPHMPSLYIAPRAVSMPDSLRPQPMATSTSTVPAPAPVVPYSHGPLPGPPPMPPPAVADGSVFSSGNDEVGVGVVVAGTVEEDDDDDDDYYGGGGGGGRSDDEYDHGEVRVSGGLSGLSGLMVVQGEVADDDDVEYGDGDGDDAGDMYAHFSASGSATPPLSPPTHTTTTTTGRTAAASEGGALSEIRRSIPSDDRDDDDNSGDSDLSGGFTPSKVGGNGGGGVGRSPVRVRSPVEGLHTMPGGKSEVVKLLSHLSRSASGGSGGDDNHHDPSAYSPFGP